jgi:hypothetical protein
MLTWAQLHQKHGDHGDPSSRPTPSQNMMKTGVVLLTKYCWIAGVSAH